MIRKEEIKDLFTFSRREKNGIWVLVVLIILIGLVNRYISFQESGPEVVDSIFKEEVQRYLSSGVGSKYDDVSYNNSETKKVIPSPEHFLFNPNNLSNQDWRKLGFSDKQIKVISNYLAKGGVFRKKSDLKKIYSISDQMYSDLEPYIDLPEEYMNSERPWKENKKETDLDKIIESAIEVNINLADTIQLKSLKGIGSYYSSKIIGYREKLGGYVSLDQLLEIYNMREETVEKIRPFLILDPSQITLIRINEINLDQLQKHPYLNYKKAQTIINYRNQHGSYNSIEDLSKVLLLTDADLKKIAPYLSFDD